MIPIRVTAEKYGPYESVEWDVPEGLTAIVGVNRLNQGVNSNGSGKTMLLEAIPLALFGPSLPWSEYLTVGDADATCVVMLVFEHGAKTYRVRRTYNGKGRGKTLLDFECEEGDEWVPLTRDKQDETQRLIVETIGLTESTFAHSVFSGQGARHFADSSLTPRERKEILSDALGLDVWGRLLERVQSDRKKDEADLFSIMSRIGVQEERMGDFDALVASRDETSAGLADVELRIATANSDLVDATEALSVLSSDSNAANTAKTRLDVAKSRVDQLKRDEDSFKDILGELKTIDDKLAGFADIEKQADESKSELDALVVKQAANCVARSKQEILASEAEKAEKDIEPLRLSLDKATAAISSARQRVSDIQGQDLAHCDRCKQELHGSSLDEAVKSNTDEADLLTTEAYNLTSRIGRLESEARMAIASAERLNTIISDFDDERAQFLWGISRSADDSKPVVTELQLRKARLMESKETLGDVDFDSEGNLAHQELQDATGAYSAFQGQDFVDVGTQESRVRSCTDILSKLQSEASKKAADLAVIQDRITQLNNLSNRIASEKTQADEINKTISTKKSLEKAYGRDGIPALILESQAIPQIETEAQRVIDELGLPYRIELLTQKENKTGGVRDTLDVVVHEPNGVRCYETYSGGEKTRLELALRIALARLIANRSASQVGLLALDEPSFLDSAGHSQLADVLRSLVEFRTIVLVSHDEALVDAFDQKVVVVRDERGSHIEDSA